MKINSFPNVEDCLFLNDTMQVIPFACFSVNGFPSILLETYELFFLEFFLSLFFVTDNNSIVLRKKDFHELFFY